MSIYVIGHKNPDNDSICSAIAYANLKNELGVIKKYTENTQQTTGRSGNANSIDDSTARGDIISFNGEVSTIVENQEYIPCRLGPLPPETIWVLNKFNVPEPRKIGHVYNTVKDAMVKNPYSVMEDTTIIEAGRTLKKFNVRSLVVEDSNGLYKGLITTRMIAEAYLSATEEGTTDLNSLENDTVVAKNLLDTLVSPVSKIFETEVTQLQENDLLKYAVEELLTSSLREAVVLDKDGRCIGILTRSDIVKNSQKSVILIDHNELAQSAPGVNEAQIYEIIDHHRIADVDTTIPILFINLPVGSTATIVSKEYENLDVMITKSMAAIMLSAILTDTVILKSPTTTSIDANQAERLAKIVGVNVEEFGIKLFEHKLGQDLDKVSVEDICMRDAKDFQVGDKKVLVAQFETLRVDKVKKREKEIRKYMKQQMSSGGYEIVLLMLTDIIREGSLFMAEGNKLLLNRAFNINCTDNTHGTWMPGILSRKKQVTSKLISVI
ncbi:MAG: putative manganese-dependent inorganic diphosphatase [Eggerthellaceae bacterium]|nr:putative manganese-dependent inorganic diphosphatase [Eggerthellaceae bacterium]